jgi:DNA segregation ATPase FtsK/SpoIIIE, S-DNA-T family
MANNRRRHSTRSRRPTSRVTNVSPWIPGGDGRLRDLFPMPPLLILTGRALLRAFHHYYISLTVIGYLILLFYRPFNAHPFIILPTYFLTILLVALTIFHFRNPSIPPPLIPRAVLYQYKVLRRWPTYLPPLTRLRSPSTTTVTATTDMSKIGDSPITLERETPLLASILHAPNVRTQRLSSSKAHVIVEYGLTSHRRTPSHRARNRSMPPLSSLLIEPGINLSTSVLIGGETGSGKSNLVWYIIAQLNQYRIPYRLTVIDPAGGVELNDLEHSPFTRRYIDRAQHVHQIINEFHASMEQRLALMKQRSVRLHTPTPQEPVEICIIDELLLCKDELQGGVLSPIGEILTVGRKAFHIIVGCTQLGQKSIIGDIRDLFPQRVCLKTQTSESTDAILGSQANVDGAYAHRIDRPGMGYVWTEETKHFKLFTTPHITDTLRISKGWPLT